MSGQMTCRKEHAGARWNIYARQREIEFE